MQMRVALARALITKPKVLLLDEPFAALDERTRFRLQDLLLDLRARLDLQYVFVTHSISEAVYLGDRVLLMDKYRADRHRPAHRISRARSVAEVDACSSTNRSVRSRAASPHWRRRMNATAARSPAGVALPARRCSRVWETIVRAAAGLPPICCRRRAISTRPRRNCGRRSGARRCRPSVRSFGGSARASSSA